MNMRLRAAAVAAGLGLALAVCPSVARADELVAAQGASADVVVLLSEDGVTSPSEGEGQKNLGAALSTSVSTGSTEEGVASLPEGEKNAPLVTPAEDAISSDPAETEVPGSGTLDSSEAANLGLSSSVATDGDELVSNAEPPAGENTSSEEADLGIEADVAIEPGVEGAVESGATPGADVPEAPVEEVEEELPVELAASSLPSVGWTGDTYWDGTLNADGTARPYTGWVIDDHDGGGLQRYWVVDGTKYTGGLFDAGADGWGYALGEGWVLRGLHTVGNLIYLANNDGRLLDPGWTVAGEFTGGELQRYYVEDDHAIHRGYSENGGYGHYVTERGYVARGKTVERDGTVVLANNDGCTEKGGWLVTDAYDGGAMQRYYVDPETHEARTGLFSVDGISYCGVAGQGYVLRGKMSWNATHVLLANNDGFLVSNPGWLVTGDYDGGAMQRYWIAGIDGWDGFFGALIDFFEAAGATYYGDHGEGYVLRNAHVWRVSDEDYTADWCLANNDGALSVDNSDYARLVNSYVASIVRYSNDDSHGYDQTWRWGERGDYDCSSLVITCLREAGLETGWATYTGNMRSSLTSYDFVWISDPSELQRGDILLNETYHTAIYLGNGMLANASGNEFGAATGGEPGDQTGREIWIRSYYDYPWNGVLRLRSYVA